MLAVTGSTEVLEGTGVVFTQPPAHDVIVMMLVVRVVIVDPSKVEVTFLVVSDQAHMVTTA